jgi:hypothetical protein
MYLELKYPFEIFNNTEGEIEASHRGYIVMGN